MSTGIILIATRDPLANLASLVFDTSYTTIGIYQEGSLHLYDIWKADRPVWFDVYMRDRNYVDEDEILSCELVSKIKLLPIDPNYVNKFRMCLARNLSIDDDIEISQDMFYLKTTGYDIINSIFLTMESIDEKAKGTISLMDNLPLLNPIKKVNSIEDSKIYDSCIYLEVEKELNKFKEYYLSSDEFRENISKAKLGNTLIEYISLEENIKESVRSNLADEESLNKLNKMRDNLGLKLLSFNDYKDVNVDSLVDNILVLKEILQNIICKRETSEPIVIKFDSLVFACNKILDNLSLERLADKSFYSNLAILTSDQSIDLEVSNKYITIYSSRLESYSKQELREILKVANEISIFDTKYIPLQNSLIKELSKRT